MTVRIQKLLSQLGIASRRQAEQMIVEGRIRLNGEVAQLGQRVDAEQDQIEVDGTIVQTGQRPDSLYILLNKPAGVVTTCRDPWGRKTVLELLPPEWSQRSGLHPVGRLDAESTGALLLTNDGDLTFHLTHPRFHIPKTYEVWVEGYPTEETLERWRQGVMLAEWPTLPAQVSPLCTADQRTLLRIVL
ncbi:MAG TPA: pseudouridine synthase, partial [Coleofasciculaceae cyanobacterium]